MNDKEPSAGKSYIARHFFHADGRGEAPGHVVPEREAPSPRPSPLAGRVDENKEEQPRTTTRNTNKSTQINMNHGRPLGTLENAGTEGPRYAITHPIISSKIN